MKKCCYSLRKIPIGSCKNAAQELYNALHGGWRELTNLLAGDIENEVANKVYDKLVEKVIAALPYGEIIKTSLHYSVDLSNLLLKRMMFRNRRTICVV